jgi:hypothetical protein
VDLAGEGYVLEHYNNGNSTPTYTLSLTGTIAVGETFVIVNNQAGVTLQGFANLLTTSQTMNFNGDDALVLRRGTNVIDSLGQAGVDPGTEWGSGLTSTADNTLRRKPSVTRGDAVIDDAFNPVTEWDGFSQDTFNGLGAHTNDCVGSVEPDPDVDGDGLPDWWEIDNFGSTTNVFGGSDWDGDRVSDGDEFVAGTDPDDINSFLEVVESAVEGATGGVVIQWPGVTGKVYRVSRGTNLLDGTSFSLLATNIAGVAPLNSYTDAPPTPANAIYRIGVGP